jgi:hypothetical protein
MALMRKGTSAVTAIANRANALKSTRPVTWRGQSISRLNAAKHWPGWRTAPSCAIHRSRAS